MLDECAPGHTKKGREHNWFITWNGRSHWRLPRGEHGARKNPDIEIGHVKNLVRQLQIPEDCVAKQLPQLGKPKP
jgi:hypothetical protein